MSRLFAVLAAFALASCGLFAASAAGPSAADVAAYEAAQLVCVDQADARAAADTSRDTIKAAWLQRWDGGGQ